MEVNSNSFYVVVSSSFMYVIRYGQTCLWSTWIRVWCVWLIFLLANPLAVNSDGQTALDMARSRGHASVVRLLEVSLLSTQSVF